MVKSWMWVVGAPALSAGLMVGLQAQSSAGPTLKQVTLEREATDLVGRVEEVAYEVQFHVNRLDSLARSVSASSLSHYEHLDSIRDLINGRLRNTLGRLEELHPQLPGWKQESITRMIAAAQSLAADATSSYLTKAKNPKLPPAYNADYRGFLTGIAGHVNALVKTADGAHAYAVGHLKATEAGLKVTK